MAAYRDGDGDGAVEVSHTLAARIEGHHCAWARSEMAKKALVEYITVCLIIAKTVKRI